MYGSSKAMSARWAGHISKESAQFETTKAEFELIMEQIEARAYKGYSDLHVMQDISPVVFEELIRLGYNVARWKVSRISW